jgi:hypothetical protein
MLIKLNLVLLTKFSFINNLIIKKDGFLHFNNLV